MMKLSKVNDSYAGVAKRFGVGVGKELTQAGVEFRLKVHSFKWVRSVEASKHEIVVDFMKGLMTEYDLDSDSNFPTEGSQVEIYKRVKQVFKLVRLLEKKYGVVIFDSAFEDTDYWSYYIDEDGSYCPLVVSLRFCMQSKEDFEYFTKTWK